MTRFFLALIATGVATLIGAIVFATFRVPDPFLHRPQSLRAAPSRERTLTPPPENREPTLSLGLKKASCHLQDRRLRLASVPRALSRCTIIVAGPHPVQEPQTRVPY